MPFTKCWTVQQFTRRLPGQIYEGDKWTEPNISMPWIQHQEWYTHKCPFSALNTQHEEWFTNAPSFQDKPLHETQPLRLSWVINPDDPKGVECVNMKSINEKIQSIMIDPQWTVLTDMYRKYNWPWYIQWIVYNFFNYFVHWFFLLCKSSFFKFALSTFCEKAAWPCEANYHKAISERF